MLFVLSLCPFDNSVGEGAFVIWLSQMSFFLSCYLSILTGTLTNFRWRYLSFCNWASRYSLQWRFLEQWQKRRLVIHLEVRSLALNRFSLPGSDRVSVRRRCRGWRRRRRLNESPCLTIRQLLLCFHSLDLFLKVPNWTCLWWRIMVAFTVYTAERFWRALTSVVDLRTSNFFFGAFLQNFLECQNFWHPKQRRGFGIYRFIVTL